MFETTTPFLQSEIAYRTDRIKSGFGAGRKRRGDRVPKSRRPAERIDRTR